MEPKCDQSIGRVRAQTTADVRHNIAPWCHLDAGSAQGLSRKTGSCCITRPPSRVCSGKKRGGGPRRTAPASSRRPEGRHSCAAGGLWRRLEPGASREASLGSSIRPTSTHRIGQGRGGVERGDLGASFPVPTAHGNSTVERGLCTGESGKCCPVFKRSALSVSNWTLAPRQSLWGSGPPPVG